jgi:formamidopyrimidine-DNA glycosylase
MTGQFSPAKRRARALVRDGSLPPEAQRVRADVHTHMRFSFEDRGPEVFFRDAEVRQVHCSRQARATSIDLLGPDALGIAAPGAWLLKRSTPVKSMLLISRCLRGWQYYADEPCSWRVRPLRPAKQVKAQWEGISAGIKQVLNRSIETGGSSISDYVRPDGQDGGYQDERKVYGREGEPCPACGAVIRRIVIATRSSSFCPRCQR